LFGRAAFGRGSGHSGGTKYRELYGQDAHALYVSAFPVSLPEPYASAFIIYAERRLIWEYVLANGRRPPCNSE
jgi:hypothetical protein